MKRKAYYKKQNYKIIGANSIDYNTNFSKWKIVYQPKCIVTNESCINKKQISIKSDSSDKSITDDSDIDSEEDDKPKDKYLSGQCLLTFKK